MITLIPNVSARSFCEGTATSNTWQPPRPIVPLRNSRFGRQGISPEWKHIHDSMATIIALYGQTCSFQSPIETEFQRLSDRWKSDTIWDSSVSDAVSHPSYRRIIIMGQAVVPMILNDLKKEPNLWFEALTEITGEQPVLFEHAGDMQAMTNDWLEWGRQNGYDC